MKVVTIIGARPQFIKAAVVSQAFQTSKSIEEIIVHTGQHYDPNMSEIFFRELEIAKPKYQLNIGSDSHGAQTGKMLSSIEKVLIDEKPELVLVYGDTNSTLAGALAAAKLHVPVAHIEAGLRSFNRQMPEEINRVLTDHASEYLFVPTKVGFNNLVQEGIKETKIYNVGDVMFDASLYFGLKADKKSLILDDLKLKPKNYILATIHRAENTDNLTRLQNIFLGLNMVSREVTVVLPLHPRTRKILRQTGILDKLPGNICLCDPIGYLDMVMLEKNAILIATDSGGVQKEAFFYKVPCVTLRNETEWVELIQLGWNCLVIPRSPEDVYKCIMGAINKRGEESYPYGEGDASLKIVDIIGRLS